MEKENIKISDAALFEIERLEKRVYELEKKMKEEMYSKATKMFEKNRITLTTINSDSEITPKIIELLERHRNANIR